MKKFIFLVLVVAGGVKLFVMYYPGFSTDAKMKRIAQEANAQLPRVYGAIRMEEVQYANQVMRASGVVLASVDINDSAKGKLEAAVKDIYCQGAWKQFADAKVGVELSLHFESVFYKNIEWLFKAAPADCH